MKKNELIKKIKNLPFGEILYGYNEDGKIVNINDYNEEKDTFNAYGEDFKCYEIKFENIPQKLFRSW